MNIVFHEHERIARIVAKELEDNGYTVVFTPMPEKIPFSLGNYTPDLLATKADENLLIEIKRREPSTSNVIERYRKIANIIQAQPNWQFLIRTFDDTAAKMQASFKQLVDLETIQKYLAKAESIAAAGNPELAVPYFWNAIVALLRHMASEAEIDFSELSDRSLVNQLYTFGEISDDERVMLLGWNELGTRAVNDLAFSVSAEDVGAMLGFARELLVELTNFESVYEN